MSAISVEERSIGVTFHHEDDASLLVWAPYATSLKLLLPEAGIHHEFRRIDNHGYWEVDTNIAHGTNYWLEIDGVTYADPASRFQPAGIHGPSQAFDPARFQWHDDRWHNIKLKDYVIYELHTGTFSPDGTFNGIGEKLDYLLDLGITAVEIMPVAQFPGDRNWGYDGVLPFAVQNSYGGPHALQQLVSTCHDKGLAVILDVVINHIGPEGNYFRAFGPYFTDKYHTPWGAAVNFDDAGCDAVRKYYIDNVISWFRDYHIDAVRLDAVHALKDSSPVHILADIRKHTNILGAETGRRHYLIAECELNDTRYITDLPNGYGMHAQWADEFHHALRVTSGQERIGYYSDYRGLPDLAKAFQHGYVFTGNFSEHRNRLFGTSTDNIPGEKFVVFSQNHDHIGNRMLGERSGALVGFDMSKVLATAVMVSPFLPLVFMGEEYAEKQPFLYFVCHTDKELVRNVREGRKREFAALFSDEAFPDPQSPDTFLKSKLDWSLLNVNTHAAMFGFYKELIALRKQYPAMGTTDRDGVHVLVNEANKVLLVTKATAAQRMCCVMNFSHANQPLVIHNREIGWTPVLYSASEQWLGPASGLLPMEESSTIAPQSAAVWITHHV